MKTKISATGLAYSVNKDQSTCRIVGIGSFVGKKLTIPETLEGYKVKSISNEAFCECTELEYVEIENGPESIGAEVFAGCTSLARVKIADSVKNIGWGAFLNCASLSEISLGNGVSEIAAKAFCGCKGRVDIPAKTAFIGEQAFSGLSEITVAQENIDFCAVDGNLYTKDGKTLLQYATGKQELTFTIPDFVTKIGNFAFSGALRLSGVRFGGNVQIVGSNAFNGCSLLWAAVLPDSVKMIEDSAFYGCSSLCAVSVGKNTDIGRGAFGQCPNLNRIRRRGKNPLWKKILIGKKQRSDSPLREFKGKNWSIKFWF